MWLDTNPRLYPSLETLLVRISWAFGGPGRYPPDPGVDLDRGLAKAYFWDTIVELPPSGPLAFFLEGGPLSALAVAVVLFGADACELDQWPIPTLSRMRKHVKGMIHDLNRLLLQAHDGNVYHWRKQPK